MRVATRARTASRRAKLTARFAGVGLTTVVALGLAAGPAAAQPGPPSGEGVQPTEVAGNPTFDDLGFECDDIWTVNNPEVGEETYQFNGFSVTIDVDETDDGEVFSFNINSDHVAHGVIVKGGPNANVYDYRPGGTEADSLLHAPLGAGQGGQDYYDISHIDFCVFPDGNNT